MAKHNLLGKLGEDAAAEYLIKKGYIIRERNWRLEHLEIDIIAEKGNTIFIVEVKTSTRSMLNAAIAVDRNKQLHLLEAANAYIKFYKLSHEVQIDVICVYGNDSCNFIIEHMQDAVRPRVRCGRYRRIR